MKRTPKQKLDILVRAGVILFNKNWKRQTAVMLGIDKKEIYRFQEEGKEVPDGIIDKILDNVEFKIRCCENLLEKYK